MDLYNIKLLLTQGKSIYDLPLRATYYARVSTDREEQINSLENQVMYFEKVIKEQDNWVFVDGYIDEGISGTSVEKREQFLHMINDAKNGKFDLILTKEISRFSRSTLDSIKYTQKLLSYGIGVHFLSDNINTFLPDSELRLTIMSSIAQEEVRKLSERVKFGYERSVEKGIVGGQLDEKFISQSISSWKAHIKHACSYNLYKFYLRKIKFDLPIKDIFLDKETVYVQLSLFDDLI